MCKTFKTLMAYRRRAQVPTQFRLDSDGNAQPNELSRFVDGQTIEGAGVFLVNDEFQNQVGIGSSRLRSPVFVTNDLTITGGDLIVNFNLGTVFNFTHNQDTAINIINIPAGASVSIELRRYHDTGGSYIIDWAASTGDFFFPGGEPPVLSTIAGSSDKIIITSYNGSNTFKVDYIGNYS